MPDGERDRPGVGAAADARAEKTRTEDGPGGDRGIGDRGLGDGGPGDGPGGLGVSDASRRSGGPLAGRRVVVTRAREQAAALVDALEGLGAEVVPAPAIEIVGPSDGGTALRAAVAALAAAGAPTQGVRTGGGPPDWVVFTSANAVRSFVEAWRAQLADRSARVAASRTSVHLPDSVSVAAIGSGTRDAAIEAGLDVDLVPERFVAEGLLAEFPDPPPGGARVLLPRAEVAREVLPEGLRRAGWTVEVVPAYRTVPAPVDGSLRSAVAHADAVCFASASAAGAFVDAYGPDVPPVIVAIGPITARRVRELGLEVAAQPGEHTIAAMVEALVDHLGDQ